MQTPKDDRRHLTPSEVQKLIAATQGSRNAARDSSAGGRTQDMDGALPRIPKHGRIPETTKPPP
jgi:hypothetical protein